MKKSYQVESIRGIATYQLPTAMSREIGRIMVRWAFFEHGLQEMNWGVASLPSAVGRIAMREPRVTDRLEMLADLIKLRGATMDWDLYKTILAQTRLTVAKRDMLAHGIWFHHKGTNEWLLQLTKGSWPKATADIISGSRKIIPESISLDVQKLRETVAEIDKLIADLKRLRASAAEPTPSQNKPA